MYTDSKEPLNGFFQCDDTDSIAMISQREQ